VSKTSLTLVSLVGALPAACLLYLLIASFLSNPGFDNMYGMMKYFAIAAVLAAAAIVLMPAGIWVFAGRQAAAEAAESESTATAAAAADSEAEAADESAALDEDVLGGDEFEEESVEVEEEVVDSGDEDVFEAGDEEDFEDFDIEGFDDEKPSRR
jgi:hypothetical protein